MTLTLFKRGKDEGAILVQRPTQRGAILSAGERRLGDWRKGVSCLKAPVAKEAEYIAAPFVRTALCNHIDDATCGTPELRRERIGDHLEFLYCFLADGRSRSVDGVVCIISTVNLDEVRATTLTSEVKTRGRSWPNGPPVVAVNHR